MRRLARPEPVPLDRGRALVAVAAQRHVGDDAHRQHARLAADLRSEPLGEREQVLPVRIAPPGRRSVRSGRCPGRNPGETAITFRRLSPSRPAPASSTKARAIWATMKRVAQPLRGAAGRVPPRDSACSAGRRGVAQAEPGDRQAERDPHGERARQGDQRQAAVEGDVRLPGAGGRRPAGPAGGCRPLRRPARAVRRSASAAWSPPGRSLTTCRRLAPSACRTASSFTRPLARMSSRFTRLTAPMRSRKSAPACISSRVGRTAATWSACRGTTSERKPASAIILACGPSTSTAALLGVDLRLGLPPAWPPAGAARSCVAVSPECRCWGARSSGLDASGR